MDHEKMSKHQVASRQEKKYEKEKEKRKRTEGRKGKKEKRNRLTFILVNVGKSTEIKLP